MSNWEFSHGKIRVAFLGKASSVRVPLLSLRHTLDVLVFPQSLALAPLTAQYVNYTLDTIHRRN